MALATRRLELWGDGSLLEVRDSYVAHNDVSSNSGWGIHLWRSAGNVVARNRADHTRRCESQVPAADCGAAALLLSVTYN